jgi:hypothetical protein
MKWCLHWRERVEADAGYRGEPLLISVPQDYYSDEQKKTKNYVRARHEQVNKRLKQFRCLHQTFRHNIEKHAATFWAAAVVTQCSIMYSDQTLWNPDYIGEVP